jgi:hypothetical protein
MDYYRLEDKDKPVLEKDMAVWWDWFCHAPKDWKTVESTTIDQYTEVVTLYTGKDDTMHEPEDPPLLWRTEIHQGDNCEAYWRYSTRAQAEFNHGRAVRNFRYSESGELVRHERRNKTLSGRIQRTIKGINKVIQGSKHR